MRTFTAAIALGVFSTAALAGQSNPTVFVSTLGNQLQSVAHQPAGFRQLFEDDFDVPGMSRFVLGRYARVLTPSEQQQFVCYFESYVVLTFTDKLSQYLADSGASFSVTGTTRPDPAGIIVYSQITHGGQPLRVDWHLAPVAGSYKVNDVTIGGVSMTLSGRNDLEGVVERNGGQASSILPVMRQQTAGIPDHCRSTITIKETR
jgi:phospholipid transport system substrate-binding protein